MAVNIYTPRFMIEMVKQLPPLRTFLRDTFFSQIKTFPTESVDFDVKKGGMAMAPFVSPRIGSTVLDRQGYKTGHICCRSLYSRRCPYQGLLCLAKSPKQ